MTSTRWPRVVAVLAALAFALAVAVVGMSGIAEGASEDGVPPDASQNRAAPEPKPGNKNVEHKTVKGPDGNPVLAGSLLVNYEADVSKARQNADAANVNGKVAHRVGEIGLAILKLPDNANLEAAKKGLEKRPGVEVVEYDRQIEPAVTNPSDYFYQQGKQYELSNQLRFARAWDMARGWDIARGRPVRAGVLDSGCAQVRDLKTEIIADYDFVNRDPYAYDDNGHGTMVAGVVGARTNDGYGMASGGWRTKILCAKIAGSSGYAYYSTMVQGMDWARDRKARVVNLSFAGRSYSQTLCDMVASVYKSGVLTVAAAGNSGEYESARYPAACKYALGVSAVNIYDNRAGFSSYGPYVDIAATGVNVLSVKNDGKYYFPDGTSFAAPEVAAAAALSMGEHNFNAGQASWRLRNSARDVGPGGKDIYYGHGVLNAAAAVAPY